MKNTLFVTGAAAAFLVLTPVAALAATSTPEHPDGPLTRITRQLTVLPGRAAPGALVKVDFACQTRGPAEKVSVTSAAIAYETGAKTAKINPVKPGKYVVTLHCGPEKSTAYLEVLGVKKQVAKVPAGAPQTGGTDGPADGAPTGPLAAAAAMGVLALGGSGLVLARRSRRD